MKNIINDFNVKCTNGYIGFKEGKVYHIKNGSIITDTGSVFNGYDTLNDLNKYNLAQFVLA